MMIVVVVRRCPQALCSAVLLLLRNEGYLLDCESRKLIDISRILAGVQRAQKSITRSRGMHAAVHGPPRRMLLHAVCAIHSGSPSLNASLTAHRTMRVAGPHLLCWRAVLYMNGTVWLCTMHLYVSNFYFFWFFAAWARLTRESRSIIPLSQSHAVQPAAGRHPLAPLGLLHLHYQPSGRC